MFLIQGIWPLRKKELLLFFCFFFPRAKVEAYFLEKLAFVTKKCLAKLVFGKCPRTTENLSKYAAQRE